MNIKDKLVTVLLFVENVEDDHIKVSVENIYNQTHKNIDLVISTFHSEDKISEDIKAFCSSKFLNCRWISHEPSANFINEALEISSGDYIFYRTINNVSWFPRHIEAHLEEFKKDPTVSWSLSHIENKDLSKTNTPFNTLSFRIKNPPNIKDICLDEMCHTKSVDCKWDECLVTEDGNPFFYAGLVLKQWQNKKLRGCIPAEITVEQWVEVEDNSQIKLEQIKQSIGKPSSFQVDEDTKITDDGDIVIDKKFPTIVGNISFEKHNENIINHISTLDPLEVKSIGIKRTMGMGDVVLVEPIIKKLRNKYSNAEINIYTASDEVVEYFSSKPDNIISITSGELLQDYLSTTDNQIKIDLDLSYESREGKSFIDSYAQVANVDFLDEDDKNVQLEIDEERLIEGNYVVVCGDGSGWPGKTWPLSYYEQLISFLQEEGYEVIETGKDTTDLTQTKYHNCDFEEMINIIANCDLYIGADNGPMHIARGFNKPCIAINGSALTNITNPNKDNICYIQKTGAENLGIKHEQFININPQNNGITFIPIPKKGDTYSGIRNIKPTDVISLFESFKENNFTGSFISEYNDEEVSLKDFAIEKV